MCVCCIVCAVMSGVLWAVCVIAALCVVHVCAEIWLLYCVLNVWVLFVCTVMWMLLMCVLYCEWCTVLWMLLMWVLYCVNVSEFPWWFKSVPCGKLSKQVFHWCLKCVCVCVPCLKLSIRLIIMFRSASCRKLSKTDFNRWFTSVAHIKLSKQDLYWSLKCVTRFLLTFKRVCLAWNWVRQILISKNNDKYWSIGYEAL